MKLPINTALACILLNSVNNASIGFVSLYFTNSLHLSSFISINLLGMYGLASLFGVLSIMFINQKIINYKRYAIYCSLLNGLIFILFPFAKANIALINLLIIALGYFNSMFTPLAVMWLLDSTHQQAQQKKLTNLRYMFTNLGMGLSLWFNGFLIKGLSYKWFFYINGFILILPMIFLTKEKNSQAKTHVEKKEQSINFINSFNKPFIYTLFLILSLISIVFSQLKSSYTLYLNQFFLLNEVNISYVFMLSTFTIVFFQIILAKLIKSFDSMNILSIACLLIGSSMSILNYNYKLIPYISSLLWTLGEMIFFPIIYTEIINGSSAKLRAKLTTLYQLFYVFSLFIGPLIGSFIYKKNPHLLWWCCLIIGVTSFYGVRINAKLKNKNL